MRHRFAGLWLGLLAAVMTADTASAAETAASQSDAKIRYGRDIAPVLAANCVPCHNKSLPEAGVNLESVDAIRESDAFELLVPGDAKSSRIFQLASHAEGPVMPPSDNDVGATRLSPKQLDALRKWIDGGAVVESGADTAPKIAWQPLPEDIATSHAAGLTCNAELAAVAFGGRVQLFTKDSEQAIESLRIPNPTGGRPAHDDFVQDLWLDANARRMITAGFRTLKFWRMEPFAAAEIPRIEADQTRAVALSGNSRFLAVLSRRGEFGVAELGTARWDWLRGFDLPSTAGGETEPAILLAVDDSAGTVAAATGPTLWIARGDAVTLDRQTLTYPITALAFDAAGQLLAGDSTGKVHLWQQGSGPTQQTRPLFETPVVGLGRSAGDSIIATSQAGEVVQIDAAGTPVRTIGQLPDGDLSGIVSAATGLVWNVNGDGKLVAYSFGNDERQTAADEDPVVRSAAQSAQWSLAVAEKQVKANEESLEQVDEQTEAEQKHLQETQKKLSETTEKVAQLKTELADADQAVERAQQEQTALESEHADLIRGRKELSESIATLTQSIEELSQELEAKQQRKEALNKRLEALPDPKDSEAALAAAKKKLEEAKQNAEKTSKSLSAANAEVSGIRSDRSRTEASLDALRSKSEKLKQTLDESKESAADLQQELESAKQRATDSRLQPRSAAVLGRGQRVLALGSTSRRWSLWTGHGNLRCDLPELDAMTGIAARSDRSLVFRRADGRLVAWTYRDAPWQPVQQIGDPAGESPFADRVLCLDADAQGRRVAIGGGEPSRSGELEIRDASQGELLHRLERPHEDTVLSLCFSPDGARLASGGADRMIHLWDVGTGKRLRSLEGHTHHVTALAWDATGQHLASGAADGVVKFWDLNTGKSTRTIDDIAAEITGLVYLGTDDRVAAVSGDGSLTLCRPDRRSAEREVAIPGGYVYAIGKDRDASTLIVAGSDGVASVIDTGGKVIRQYRPTP